MVQNMVYLGTRSLCSWKERVIYCCCVLLCSRNVTYIKLVDSLGQVFYVLILCFLVLSNIDRGVFKSLTIMVNLSILLTVLSVFALCIFEHMIRWTLRSITSSCWTDPFVIMKLSLSLVIFFALKSTLSDINNTATPAFFWLVLVWCIFFHPFTF